MSSYPTIDKSSGILYLIESGRNLVAYNVNLNKIVYNTRLKSDIYSNLIIYEEYIVLCDQKKIFVYTKDLNHVASYIPKGTVKGTNIVKDGPLQILVSDYQSWDNGKCDLCYSRVYELTKR